jgi:hypothetical protein
MYEKSKRSLCVVDSGCSKYGMKKKIGRQTTIFRSAEIKKMGQWRPHYVNNEDMAACAVHRE